MNDAEELPDAPPVCIPNARLVRMSLFDLALSAHQISNMLAFVFPKVTMKLVKEYNNFIPFEELQCL